MTLHSIATSYPETPSIHEKQLMTTWLDMFRDTITCPSCKGHFTNMLQNYRMRFPNMMNSRQDFAMFSFRAHNAVNARLHKPVYDSLDACMTVLRNAIQTRKPSDYRISYINHITRHWRTMQDISGIVALKKVTEMKKIEIEYIGPRDTKFEVTLVPEMVVIPRNWVEPNVKETTTQPLVSFSAPPRVGFQIQGGRIRLR